MKLRSLISVLTAAAASLSALATYPLDLEVSLSAGGGNGDFAPYYIGSNTNGRTPQADNVLFEAALSNHTRVNSRLSYEWGVDLAGGWASSASYARYNAATESWSTHSLHPSRAWIQQLYGRVDYRSLFLSVGQRDSRSALLDNELSSGDLVRSANARGIPEVMAGFNDFQPIPFTNGWVEIQGVLSYGKMTDSDWVADRNNDWNSHVCRGAFYTYKRCYFRTKSSQPLTLTLGMQVASFFGGTSTIYRRGEGEIEKHPGGIKEFFKMLIPAGGDEDYYLGSTLGSWDIVLNYRLPHNAGTLKGYLQKPWETGSGVGFLNGFDGLWGLEYRAASRGIVYGAVVEYIDFTNQSGPIHFDPTDIPGCNLPGHTDGGDDYYNNCTYNAYANYGMSLGTPFLRSPLYNTDGYLQFVDNLVRGFHIGVTGTLSSRLSYKVMGGYRKGWGSPRTPRGVAVDDTSWMVEGSYRPAIKNENITVTAQVAMDRGTMYGNTLGALLTVKYNLNIGRR